MKEKKRISLVSYIIALFIIAIAIIVVIIILLYSKNKQENYIENTPEQNTIENKVEENQINDDSSKEDEETKKTTKQKTISYIEIEVKDNSRTDVNVYKEALKIENETIIDKLQSIINNSKIWTDFDKEFGASGYFEGCPVVTFYRVDGKKFYLTTKDNFSGNFNATMLWSKNDGSDKKIYKVDYQLEKYIENAYKTNGIIENDKTYETTSNTKYEEIKKELDGIDVLYVTDIEKNDEKYTLKGVIYTQYTLSAKEMETILAEKQMVLNNEVYTLEESQGQGVYELYKNDVKIYNIKRLNTNTYYLEGTAQISDVWKITNNYKIITVNKNLIIEDSYSGETKTVEEEFNNFESKKAENKTNPFPAYSFEFENDNCIKVIRVTTGV